MTDKPKELHEMPWGEALSRLIETKPHEVEPPPGKKAKASPVLPKATPKQGNKPSSAGKQ